MSERDPHDPKASPVSTGTQIPHSGVHGFELPVRDFDKTPLGKAVERGWVQIPDSPAPLGDHLEKAPGWRPRRWQVITAISATAAALAAGFAVANNDRGDRPITTIVDVEPTATQPTPDNPPVDTSAPEAPEVQPTQDNHLSPEVLAELSRDELIEAGQVSAADAPTANDLPQAISDRLAAIAQAGTLTDQEYLAHSFNVTRENKAAYASAMVERYSRPFMEGLFGASAPQEFPQATAQFGRQYDFLNMQRSELTTESYSFTSQVVEDTVEIADIGNGAYIISWHTHDKDNYGDLSHLIGNVNSVDGVSEAPYIVTARIVGDHWEITRQ